MVAGKKFLRAALIALFLLSATVWGLWDPNTDPCLVFNMDFETHTSSPYTATDSVAGLKGDVQNLTADANYTPWMTGPNALFGTGTSFDIRDQLDAGGADVDSCRLTIDRKKYAQNANPLFKDTFTLSPTVGPNYADTVLVYSAWIRSHDLAGTIIGQRYDNSGLNNWNWQWRLRDQKLMWQSKFNDTITLDMESTQTFTSLGIAVDQWHQVAIVVDRRSRYASRMYVDGAPIDVTVNRHDPNAAYIPTDPCVFIGCGDNGLFDDFDGQLDEIRLYRRDLNDLEMSLLYQWAPGFAGPYAMDPLPNYKQISTYTGLEWVPVSGATSQNLILGDDPNLDDPCNVLIKLEDLTGSDTSVSNAEIGGQLDFGTVYYWRVDANNGSSFTAGPVWKFTTDVGYAIEPVPADGATEIPIEPLNLQWTGSPDACSFDVYFSEEADFDPNTQEANDITDSNVVVFDPCNLPVRGKTYYWRVESNFSGGITIAGPVWSFRAESNKIIVNTSDIAYDYNGRTYPALSMTWLDSNTVVNGSKGTDDVAIFDLNDVNITELEDVIVIPLFDNTVQADMNTAGVRETSRPMAIHVNGDFICNGRIDISGETVTEDPVVNTYWPKACCGGYMGCRRDIRASSPGYYVDVYDPCNVWHNAGSKDFYVPTAGAYAVFGPGIGFTTPYLPGGGAGYGGIGGESGRGWDRGLWDGGDSYGSKEVPVPVGGSSGSWGKYAPGGAGGGGIEIAATGSVIFGPNAKLYAKGGACLFYALQASGGGAGGSVRIIADGNFVNQGIISVDGGKGTDSSNKANDCGGGGGGGRVAIWYGGTYSNTGQITAAGGVAGIYTANGSSNASPGQDGTIFVSNGDPRKAGAPTPKDGDKTVYVSGGSGTIDLKWCAGYGGTTAQVYFGTVDPPVTTLGSPTDANRGEHSITSPTLSAGTTYYWKVTTDGTVDSDVWSFTVVDWQCSIYDADGVGPFNVKPEWDTFPHSDCIVTFEDFAHFAMYWMARDNMAWGTEGQGITVFMNEWLNPSGRTP
jgi:hypothetical protein